jgi:DNA topoisomerase VI subunit B
VPFTSESKEALAHYTDIIKEIKLALQEAGRRLQSYVHKKNRVRNQLERANLFERYMPEVADSLSRLTGEDKDKLLKKLQDMIKKDEIQNQIHDMESLKGDTEDDRTKHKDEDDFDDESDESDDSSMDDE